jgi:hypothetical protein
MKLAKGLREMRLAEALGDFLHRYEDRDAITFTIGSASHYSSGEAIFDVLSCHPTACLPLTAEDFPVRQPKKPRDFPVRQPKKPRVLSVEALERRQRRKEDRDSEKAFLAQELATATALKFLDILEREKADYCGYPGKRQKTWIYVEYKGKRLGIGTFEWIAGDSQPYIRFSKAKV